MILMAEVTETNNDFPTSKIVMLHTNTYLMNVSNTYLVNGLKGKVTNIDFDYKDK